MKTTTPTAPEEKDQWNQRHPIGTPVVVLADDGKTFRTTTTSRAWLFGPRTAVVNLEGITGPYPIRQVTAETEQQTAA